MTESPRLQQIREWLNDSPDDPELHYALAMELRSSGDDVAASAELAKLIRARPDFVPSYLMQSQLLIKLVRDDEARVVLSDGIAAARKAGNDHALSELQALLDSLS